MRHHRMSRPSFVTGAAICVLAVMALGAATSAATTPTTTTSPATVKRQMLRDLTAEGWKKERIYRIDVKNHLATFLVGPFECPITFPLVRTKSGTGYLYWWPYERSVNDGLIFPFPPSAVTGLATSCQP